jgi:hypothetical protein
MFCPTVHTAIQNRFTMCQGKSRTAAYHCTPPHATTTIECRHMPKPSPSTTNASQQSQILNNMPSLITARGIEELYLREKVLPIYEYYLGCGQCFLSWLPFSGFQGITICLLRSWDSWQSTYPCNDHLKMLVLKYK